MRWLGTVYASLWGLLVSSLAGSGVLQAQQLPNADDAAWAEARQAGSAEACQGYLQRFPAGRHAEQAFRCLIESRLEAEGRPSGLVIDVY
jgi:hypothetical protein